MNKQGLLQFARGHWILMIYKECGDNGIAIYEDLLEALHRIYEYVDPEICASPIVIFASLNNEPLAFDGRVPRDVADATLLSNMVDARSPFTLQALPNGRFLLWDDYVPSVDDLSRSSIVYKYTNAGEHFFANGHSSVFPCELGSGYLPMFKDVRDALEHYYAKKARRSTCTLLSEIWHDQDRLFLRNGPEDHMRDSLYSFLDGRIRDVEVNPEENVDAITPKPVDLRLKWMFCNRTALVEIKWLGKSKHSDGRDSVTYTDARAREGANQLDDYLERHCRRNPLHWTRGYLVVFDARRGARNHLEYSGREIVFSPEYHKIRDDFAPPIRLYLEPKQR
ncbi:hypothetical protein LLG46_05765 [bacterium]|nr:hypothetical protein [bacterium]